MPNASDFTARAKSLSSSSAMSRANQSEVVQSFDFGFGAGARRGTLLIGAEIFPRMW